MQRFEDVRPEDGERDDTEYLQAMIDRSETIPPGIYTISRALVLRSNQGFYGVKIRLRQTEMPLPPSDATVTGGPDDEMS